jgi:hypothetical protein
MKAEIRSIIMIVLRFPELISIVFFYSLSYGEGPDLFKTLCYSSRECITIVDLANVFYILSLSLNFFFYYFFNKAFKFSFSLLMPFKSKANKLAQITET